MGLFRDHFHPRSIGTWPPWTIGVLLALAAALRGSKQHVFAGLLIVIAAALGIGWSVHAARNAPSEYSHLNRVSFALVCSAVVILVAVAIIWGIAPEDRAARISEATRSTTFPTVPPVVTVETQQKERKPEPKAATIQSASGEKPFSGNSASLFVECNLGTMPRDTGPSNRLYVLNVFPVPSENGGGGLIEYYTLKERGELTWPSEGSRPLPAYRCKLTNYGNYTMLNVAMSAHLLFLRGVPDKGNPSLIHSGDVFLERDWPFSVTKIEPGTGNAFDFNIIYLGKDFVHIVLPQTADFQVPGETRRKTIRVTQPTTRGEPAFVSLGPFIPDKF